MWGRGAEPSAPLHPQLPSLCLSDPTSWDPRQGSRLWRPNSGLTPRGRKGRRLHLEWGTWEPPPPSAWTSPLPPAAAARGTSATCGPPTEVRAIPEEIGRLRAFYFCGAGGRGGGRISTQHSPRLRNSLARSPFPSRSFHANLVHPSPTAPSKHLTAHLL